MTTDARIAALAALCLAGCAAGAARPAQAPPAATAAPSGQPADQPASATAAAPMAAPAPPPAAAAAPAEEKGPSMEDEVGDEMRKAEREIAAGNCPTACRALASMERAVLFLCTGNQSREDADRCAVARQHLRSARHRIRTTCGECPGGPSVEPDAPVPSTK